MTAPYRIEGPELTLVAPDPERAFELGKAVMSSLDELRPFMPWAHEPPDGEGALALVRSWRAAFDRDEDRHYHMLDEDGVLVGNCGSHPRVRGHARELGYWVRTSAHRKGYASAALRALATVELLHHGLERVDLFIDETNLGSRRVAEKVGFEPIALMRGHQPWHDGTHRDALLHTMHHDALPESALDAYRLYDVIGRPITR